MKNNSPKVSVLLSTYNRPDTLKEAVQSVTCQTMKDWELLVMNDGGVDVAHIIDTFNDPRIRYYPDDVNRKLPYRFNFGMKAARGQYIAYLGDDDLYYPNHIEVLSKTLDENPEIGAAYSDLYGVQFVKGETTGKRYPLNKMIQVSRDYNRDFMFYFNHTLHVSLMHRRELGLKVGGYDESVRVLIDWNITRKLSYYTDFKYVSVLTGEYYMPICNSDRISNLERKDPENFKHNLRKIKADHPPMPWPKVERIGVILPVDENVEPFKEVLTEFIDSLSYPVRFVLVNNKTGKTEAQLRKGLGKIGKLKNIAVLTPPKPLSRLDAYRFGAENIDVKYVYLPSEKARAKFEYRLIAALHYLHRTNKIGAKWSIENEKDGPFDIIIERDRFLDISNKQTGRMEAVIGLVPPTPAPSLTCDMYHHLAKQHRENGNYQLALKFIKTAAASKKGGVKDPFLIDLYSRICFDLKAYNQAEEKCRPLIEQGYGADNYIRLGRILQAQGKTDEAIEAFRQGLNEIGLNQSDLAGQVFPILSKVDFGSFTAYIGLGECFFEKGDLAEASRMYHLASKLKGNSHLPFLGFGRIFLKSGELGRAEIALRSAENRCTENIEILRLLGDLFELKNQPESAFYFYKKAFGVDPTDAQLAASFYRVGSALGRWDDMKTQLIAFLDHRPGHLPTIKRLALIYEKIGRYAEAMEVIYKGIVLDPSDDESRDIRDSIQQRTQSVSNF